MCLRHNTLPAYKITTQGGDYTVTDWESALIIRRGNPVRVAVELPVLIGRSMEFDDNGQQGGGDGGIGVPQAR